MACPFGVHMKKTVLLAALAAGFASAASAHLHVYGLADFGLAYQSGMNATGVKDGAAETQVTKGDEYRNFGPQSSGYWGVHGDSQFGQNTVFFALESSLDLRNGGVGSGGVTFDRDAYLGVRGNWGSLSLGNQANAGRDYLTAFDPFAGDFGQADAASTFGAAFGSNLGSSIKYTSPNYKGFEATAVLHYNFDRGVKAVQTSEDASSVANYDVSEHSKGVSLGALYAGNALSVAATFEYQGFTNVLRSIEQPSAAPGKTTFGAKAFHLGATYDFNVVKVHAAYGHQRDGLVSGGYEGLTASALANFKANPYGQASNNAINPGLRTHAWLLGVSAPVTSQGKVLVSYQGNFLRHVDVANEFATAHVVSAAYQHNFTKRTSAYAAFSYGVSAFLKVEPKDNGKPEEAKKTIQGNASKVFSLGVQHRF